MKNKLFFLSILLFLFNCYSYKEANKLAIPPVAKDELQEVLDKKNNKKADVKNEKLNKNETNN